MYRMPSFGARRVLMRDASALPPHLFDRMVSAIHDADARIGGAVWRTAVLEAADDAAQGTARDTPAGARLAFKCENLQRTGSFKVRGALNRIGALTAAERTRGVVTSSTGNHALAVAYALRRTGVPGRIVLSRAARPHKVAALRASGVPLEFVDGGALDAEQAARARAEREGLTYVSPYNDPLVMAGQGTIGLEILEQCPDVEAVYVAVGGGGLIAGIAAAIKAARPEVRVVGCWPAASPALYEALRAGRVVEVPEQPTLSDATAGGLEEDLVTLPYCRALIDECVLVAEPAIRDAMRAVLLRDGMVVEGAAGVALAGYRELAGRAPEYARARSVVVLCGRNVDGAVLRDLAGDDHAGEPRSPC